MKLCISTGFLQVIGKINVIVFVSRLRKQRFVLVSFVTFPKFISFDKLLKPFRVPVNYLCEQSGCGNFTLHVFSQPLLLNQVTKITKYLDKRIFLLPRRKKIKSLLNNFAKKL